MAISAVQEWISVAQTGNVLEWSAQSLLLSWILIAQEYSDNLLNNCQIIANQLVESGHIWTLLIGFVLGYLFRNLTAY